MRLKIAPRGVADVCLGSALLSVMASWPSTSLALQHNDASVLSLFQHAKL